MVLNCGQVFGNGNSSSFIDEAKSVDCEEALWVKSPLPDISTVVGLTIPEILRKNIGVWGHLPAFTSYETGVSYTHDEIFKNSRGFAAFLMKRGFKQGATIAIVLPNIPEYPSILFGIWEAGLVASLVNFKYTHEETKRQLEMSDAVCVVTEMEHLASVKLSQESNPKIKSIIIVGKAHEGCLAFHEIVKTDTLGVDFFKGSSVDTTEELALLPFSSGTTGPPKAVMLTHANLATNLLQCDPNQGVGLARSYVPGKEQERQIGLLPFFHSYGLHTLIHQGMLFGAHTLCLRRFEPQTFLAAIRQHKPTILHLVTPLISHIVSSEHFGTVEFEAIHTIMGAAAPVGPSLVDCLLEKAGKYFFFQQGFGLTEASPATHKLLPHFRNSKVGSCGSPIPGTITKIVNKNGRAVGRNIKGELCIKGGQIMKGYYKNEEATRITIDTDGWLHTGDIGYYDDDGNMYIVDRLKELIKVQGFSVSPSELEDLLRQHDKVEDVAVIGVPDERNGEAPRAYIVKKSNTTLTEEEIHSYLKPLISKHKQLKGGIEFRNQIPKAASGKILRRELMLEYKQKTQDLN